MKKEFTISVFTEDNIGLLNRVCIVFTRRHINIESVTVSESEIEGVHRYTVVVCEEEELVKKVVAQLDKQVETYKAFYYETDEIVYQEIALYKVPTYALASGKSAEKIVRSHNARILSVEPEFTVVEKTGLKAETQQLFDELEPFGILEFVRSGRIAISKPMKEMKTVLEEIETGRL